jgi:hypothetical protein
LQEAAKAELEGTADELAENPADGGGAEDPAQEFAAEEEDHELTGQERASGPDESQAAGSSTTGASGDGEAEAAGSAAGEEQVDSSEGEDAEAAGAAGAAEPEAPSALLEGLEDFKAVPVPHSTMAEPALVQGDAPPAGSAADLQHNATGTAGAAGGLSKALHPESDHSIDEVEVAENHDSGALEAGRDEIDDVAAGEGLPGAQQQSAQNLTSAGMEGLEEGHAAVGEAEDLVNAAGSDAREKVARSGANMGEAGHGSALHSADGTEAGEGSLSQAAGLGGEPEDGFAPATAESMQDESEQDESVMTEPLSAAEQLQGNDTAHAMRDEL